MCLKNVKNRTKIHACCHFSLLPCTIEPEKNDFFTKLFAPFFPDKNVFATTYWCGIRKGVRTEHFGCAGTLFLCGDTLLVRGHPSCAGKTLRIDFPWKKSIKHTPFASSYAPIFYPRKNSPLPPCITPNRQIYPIERRTSKAGRNRGWSSLDNGQLWFTFKSVYTRHVYTVEKNIKHAAIGPVKTQIRPQSSPPLSR